MNENQELFRKLLTINELYELYYQIGESVLTSIDLKYINRNRISVSNSIDLLIGTSFITYDEQTDTYYKQTDITESEQFINELYKRLLSNYADAFSFVNEIIVHYDELEASYYTKRNYISLSLSGLLMLLDGMGIILLKESDIYFCNKGFLDAIKKNRKRKTSIDELYLQLQIQEELGDKAECLALEYEQANLISKNIFMSPERVSLYDVSAGYDIASYMRSDSNIHDKFIEVKSCADETLRFFMSRNEVEIAKNKGENYFLYLLNRKTTKFTIVNNPYKLIFEKSDGLNWAIEPQVYQIHSIR